MFFHSFSNELSSTFTQEEKAQTKIFPVKELKITRETRTTTGQILTEHSVFHRRVPLAPTDVFINNPIPNSGNSVVRITLFLHCLRAFLVSKLQSAALGRLHSSLGPLDDSNQVALNPTSPFCKSCV